MKRLVCFSRSVAHRAVAGRPVLWAYSSTSASSTASTERCAEDRSSAAAEPSVTALFERACHYVPKHGFSAAAVRLACSDLDVSPAFAGAAAAEFDSTGDTAGALGLFYIKSNNIAAVRSVTTQMKSDGEDGVPSSPQRSDGLDSAILEALLWNRLERNIPFRTRLPQLMALVASHPSRAISGLSLLQSFIDECMFVAGQRTAEAVPWYSYRLSMGALYGGCELYQSTDSSEGCKETQQFLSRRVSDAIAAPMKLSQLRGGVETVIEAAPGVLRSFFEGGSGASASSSTAQSAATPSTASSRTVHPTGKKWGDKDSKQGNK